MLKVIIDRMPISGQFSVMLAGHAPNPQFRELVGGAFKTAMEAYQNAQLVFRTVSVMTSRDRGLAPKTDTILVTTLEAQEAIRQYTYHMAFEAPMIIDDRGQVMDGA